MIQCQRLRKVPECGTLENPPGSEDRLEGPAWCLPEADKFVKDFECEEAIFNTCAFQLKERTRWFKLAKFAGRLTGLVSPKRKCQCPKYFKHKMLIRKEKAGRAARYPQDLALEFARMLIKACRRVLTLEWWRHKQLQSQDQLNQAKRDWAERPKSAPSLGNRWTTRTWWSFGGARGPGMLGTCRGTRCRKDQRPQRR